MRYYLAIDQGTHASRACLFDETGRLHIEHSKTIKLDRISNTHIEQDANEIVNSVKEVVTKVLHEADTKHTISACGIAVQRSSVIAWHKDGTTISPVLSWQDTRGSQQLDGLKNIESEIQQLSGLPLSAHYGASKLHYLMKKSLIDTGEQSLATGSLRLSPMISYLLFHILEEQPYIVDHTNAQRTQLLSLADLNWSPRLTELFDVPLQTLPDCVPVLNNTDISHGTLIGTEIPVTAVCGDQNAVIFGAGSLSADTALVNFGSGAFILRILTHYKPVKQLLSTLVFSENSTVQYAREATINGAGSALTWLEKRHKIKDLWKQLPVWLKEVDHPPVFINSIGGFGSPWWNNSITPEFFATDRSPYNIEEDPASQAVAVIESIVFMVCANLEIMQSEQALKRLRVCGGLSLLDGLCQRLADLSTLPIERIKHSESTARGIAWLAAGKPDGWSNVELEIYKPADNASLNERYAAFRATMAQKI